MPKMMKATITEKATLISTTSGMPTTPTAARMSPFSKDMNPTTWVRALRRVIIISRPMSTMESARARSSRVIRTDWRVSGSTRTTERPTRQTPAIMVGPMPSTVSTVRWMRKRKAMRRSATGIAMALNSRAMAAVM